MDPMGDSAPTPTTRPPLWRPRVQRASPLAVAGVALSLLFLGAWFGVALWEGVFLASPAAPVVVTIAAVDHAHADGDGPASLRYLVMLPDGSTTHLWSPNVYQVGDRLSALAARGRITGRTFVSSPYAVLPRD
jgi:hypothetical protein